MAINPGHRQPKRTHSTCALKRLLRFFPAVKHRHGKHRLLQNPAKALAG